MAIQINNQPVVVASRPIAPLGPKFLAGDIVAAMAQIPVRTSLPLNVQVRSLLVLATDPASPEGIKISQPAGTAIVNKDPDPGTPHRLFQHYVNLVSVGCVRLVEEADTLSVNLVAFTQNLVDGSVEALEDYANIVIATLRDGMPFEFSGIKAEKSGNLYLPAVPSHPGDVPGPVAVYSALLEVGAPDDVILMSGQCLVKSDVPLCMELSSTLILAEQDATASGPLAGTTKINPKGFVNTDLGVEQHYCLLHSFGDVNGVPSQRRINMVASASYDAQDLAAILRTPPGHPFSVCAEVLQDYGQLSVVRFRANPDAHTQVLLHDYKAAQQIITLPFGPSDDPWATVYTAGIPDLRAGDLLLVLGQVMVECNDYNTTGLSAIVVKSRIALCAPGDPITGGIDVAATFGTNLANDRPLGAWQQSYALTSVGIMTIAADTGPSQMRFLIQVGSDAAPANKSWSVQADSSLGSLQVIHFRAAA
jgi:hypothetical protein